MCHGGGRWDGFEPGFIETQIWRHAQNGVGTEIAKRFVHAMQFGGLTTNEVYGLMVDRFLRRDGLLFDLIDESDLPDRWFRNAWARSSNGGPVTINLAKARQIQWAKARHAVDTENARRRLSFEPVPEITPAWETLRLAMRNARDDEELRRVWPDGVAC